MSDSPLPGAAVRHVGLAGDIDLATAPAVAAMLTAQARGDVAVDLGAVEFLDLAGGRMLLGAAARARDRGDRFAIVRPSTAALRLLELAGFAEALEITRDAPPAVCASGAEAP